MRLASANAYTNNVNNLTTTRSELATLQDRLSSGKRVTKASDDPISAANAERALNRITQLQAQQRALGLQQDSINLAESSLGTAGTLMQRFRELTVSAGNAANNASDRQSIASEMQSVRDQIFNLANTKDSNGVYLFSGLQSNTAQGATKPPFTAAGAPPNQTYTFNGTPGQNAPTQSAVPFTQDGNAIFMQVPKGNGVYDVSLGATNTGRISTDIGLFNVNPPGTAMSSSYQIQFTVTGNTTAYDVIDTATNTSVLPAVPAPPLAYTSDQPISFAVTNASGVTGTVSLTVQGIPGNGDTVDIKPFTPPNQIVLGAGNTGLTTANTTLTQLSSAPAGATLSGNYQISFNDPGTGMTYSVNSGAGLVASGPYVPGQPVQLTDGTHQFYFSPSVMPASGDTVDLNASTPAVYEAGPADTDLFTLMDKAISGIANQSSTSVTLNQSVAKALTQIDAGMNKLAAARGQAGIWLNQADSFANANSNLSTQLQSDLSNAQDLDMVAGISEFQAKQTGYQAALQSYAQIQKLSLFDYIR